MPGTRKTLPKPAVSSKIGATKPRKETLLLNYKSLSPKHSEFHAAFFDKKIPTSISAGSVGSGKTRMCCAQICRLLLTEPEWIGKTFLVAGITSVHLRQLLVVEFKKILTFQDEKGRQRGLIPGRHYKLTMHPMPLIEFYNGSKIQFVSLESGINLRGFNVSGVFGDDLTGIGAISGSGDQEATWDALCDRAGREEDGITCIMGTCNPTNKESWIYKRYFEPAENGTLNRDMIYVQTLTLYDNPSLKKRWPILEQMYKPGTVEHRRKILGEWCSQSGLVMTAFKDSNIMNRDFMAEFIREGVSYTGHDFGGRDPTTCLWICKFKDGNGVYKYYVYREYYNQVPGTPISTHSRQILSFTEKIARRWSDTATESVNTYRENGLNLTLAQKTPGSVVAGLSLVNQLFESNLLYVADCCPNLIRELRSMEWKQNTIRDEPKHGGDHAVDPLRYVMLEIASFSNKIASFFATQNDFPLQPELPSEIKNLRTINYDDEDHNKGNDTVFIGMLHGKPLYARSP